jgi:hypothetical protein
MYSVLYRYFIEKYENYFYFKVDADGIMCHTISTVKELQQGGMAMGDIADMMLEGLLDEETGEYIGDINEEIYGTASPGFPISYERQHRESKKNSNKASCPICGKRVKKAGIDDHIRDVHDSTHS